MLFSSSCRAAARSLSTSSLRTHHLECLLSSVNLKWSSKLSSSLSLRSARSYHASSTTRALIPFNLPDIGEGIAEVEILKWSVREGDKISQFDKLVEVQSDKATVDITSRFDGIVQTLCYKVGEMAATGKPLVMIETGVTAGGGASASGAAAAAAAPSSSGPAAASSSSSSSSAAQIHSQGSTSDESLKSLATPAVRRIAREGGIQALTSVRGTGKDGRVLKEDIQRYLEEQGTAQQSTATKASPAAAVISSYSGSSSSSPHNAAEAPSSSSSSSFPITRRTGGAPIADTVVPLKGLSKAMAKSMTNAWTVPHFGYCDEVIVDGLIIARDILRPLVAAATTPSATAASSREGSGPLKLSFLPLIIKATSMALAASPSINATVAPDASSLTIRGSHNIGIAMDSPRGLIVPNIKDVASLSIVDIAKELARLQALAKAGRLGEADLKDGTFTLSNIGSIGGTYASPVLFVPQIAIGAIGKVQKLPRFPDTLPSSHPKHDRNGSTLVAAHVLTVSWAADHRVVDGASIARFSNAWKKLLEDPLVMLAELR